MLELTKEIEYEFNMQFIDLETKNVIKVEISSDFIAFAEFTEQGKLCNSYNSNTITTGFLNLLRKVQTYFTNDIQIWSIDFYLNLAQYFPRNESPDNE